MTRPASCRVSGASPSACAERGPRHFLKTVRQSLLEGNSELTHLFSPFCRVKCYLMSFPRGLPSLPSLLSTDILKSVESGEAVLLRCVSDSAACSWERRPHCHHGQASAPPPLEVRRLASASPAGTGLVPPTVEMSLPGAVGMGSDCPQRGVAPSTRDSAPPFTATAPSPELLCAPPRV